MGRKIIIKLREILRTSRRIAHMTKIYKEQENLFNHTPKKENLWIYVDIGILHKRENVPTKIAKCCVVNFQE
jgi:hypothetical protein